MTKKKYKRGTIIHGIGASEHLDSAGERILVKGIDISSLTKDGTLTFEHQNKETRHIVGKILEAKKIFSASDCDNEHHEKFWNKLKMPFLYIKGELFDGVDHDAAKDLAAMLRYDQTIDKRKTKPLINFSIEGGKLDQDGGIIKTSVARKITITITPCNKVCEAELFEGAPEEGTDIESKINKLLGKSEVNTCEIMMKAEEVPCDLKKPKKKKRKKKSKEDFFVSNVRKALTAGCGVGAAASTRTGHDSISTESISNKSIQKVFKSISDDSFNRFNKKEELIQFLSDKLPNLKKKEIVALAKAVAYVSEKKKESKLNKLSKVHQPVGDNSGESNQGKMVRESNTYRPGKEGHKKMQSIANDLKGIAPKSYGEAAAKQSKKDLLDSAKRTASRSLRDTLKQPKPKLPKDKVEKNVNFADPKHEAKRDKKYNLGTCSDCGTKQRSSDFAFWHKDKPVCNDCYPKVSAKQKAKNKGIVSRVKNKILGKK